MNLVLIETSGNQHYIFSTNKLRENVGASELTYQIGTKAVMEAIGCEYSNPLELQTFLLDADENRPIETQGDDGVEVIIATSGKALLLTKSFERAKLIVRKITLKALREMPGLTVHGAIVEVDEELSNVHDAVGKVHRKLEEIRYKLPSNLQRFQRSPFVEPCATSGLPASEIVTFKNARGNDTYAFSAVTVAKRKALATNSGQYANHDDFKKGRIINLLQDLYGVELPKNLEEFEKVFPDTKWLSVIHADGNGLGEIFLKFDEHSASSGREYIKNYRRFSIALDICTFNAAGYALKNLQFEVTKDRSDGEVPVIPLVLGGDDLTVLCDGEYAIKFTKDFLEQFERETRNLNATEELKSFGIGEAFSEIAKQLTLEDAGKQKQIVETIANRAFGVPHLGIGAGVAIIKPHFPFHQAYRLAESLLRSAKTVKEKVTHSHQNRIISFPCSSLDFHVLYDTSGIELDHIRTKLQVDSGKTKLFAKPYVVGDPVGTILNPAWLVQRRWEKLEKRVSAMLATESTDAGKRKLPSSQLHRIRESLFRGYAETNSEVNLFGHRYKDKGFDDLLCGDSLFFAENDNGDRATHFLDALDVVELWNGFERMRADDAPANQEVSNGK